MKFKVGDKVRVLDGENISEYTQGWNMPEFIGDIVTIKDCKQYSDGRVAYQVIENYYTFDERGLEPVAIRSALFPYVEYVFNEKQAEEYAERINKELTNHFNAFSNNGISAKNGGKNSMKFTFYTEEGYRIDKSNNSKVETITTFVKINGFDNTYLGMATCDKVDYSEREGVINALANAMCNGNFDREFNKAVKDNARADKKKRTCTYCGQLFDTVEEKQAHEAWHVERKKARRERYLLRKRAKEIAFEEQAQKMAKEITAEDNKK